MKAFRLAVALGVALSTDAVRIDADFESLLNAATRDVAKLGDMASSASLLESQNKVGGRQSRKSGSQQTKDRHQRASGKKAIPGMVSPKIVNFDLVDQTQTPDSRKTQALHVKSSEPIWSPGTHAAQKKLSDAVVKAISAQPSSSTFSSDAQDPDPEPQDSESLETSAPNKEEKEQDEPTAAEPAVASAITKEDLDGLEARIIESVTKSLHAEGVGAQGAGNPTASGAVAATSQHQQQEEEQDSPQKKEAPPQAVEPPAQVAEEKPIAGGDLFGPLNHDLLGHPKLLHDLEEMKAHHPSAEEHAETMMYIEDELDEIAEFQNTLLHKTSAIESAVSTLGKIALENHQHDAGARTLIHNLQESLQKLSSTHAKLGMLDALDHLDHGTGEHFEHPMDHDEQPPHEQPLHEHDEQAPHEQPLHEVTAHHEEQAYHEHSDHQLVEEHSDMEHQHASHFSAEEHDEEPSHNQHEEHMYNSDFS